MHTTPQRPRWFRFPTLVLLCVGAAGTVATARWSPGLAAPGPRPAKLAGAQAGRKLDRFPEQALLANGRVVEAGGPGTPVLLLRGNTAGRDDAVRPRFDLLHSTLRVDLAEADGEVYFLERDQVVSLADAWSRLHPGQLVEIATHPDHTATVQKVRGTAEGDELGEVHTRPGQAGPPGTFGRTVRQAIAVKGWIYVWVLREGP